MPSLPSNVELIGGPEGGALPLSEWQVDALMRRRTRENVEGAVQTLNSIVKLVDQLKNMPVGMDVKGDVLHSLEQLEEVRVIQKKVHLLILSSGRCIPTQCIPGT